MTEETLLKTFYEKIKDLTTVREQFLCETGCTFEDLETDELKAQWKFKVEESIGTAIRDPKYSVQLQRLRGILLNHPGVFGHPPQGLTFTTAGKCRIVPKSKGSIPYSTPSEPRNEDEAKFLKEELESMVSQGIVRRSNSSYASPVLIVPKKTLKDWGETPLRDRYRMVCDYRQLNEGTQPQSMPLSEGLAYSIRKMGRGKFFTWVDAKKAFHQVLMDPESIHMTAITTPFGLYEYTRMPFGLQCSGGVWCDVMRVAFQNIPDMKTWIDDSLLVDQDCDTHVDNIEKMLKASAKWRILLSIEKSKFGDETGEFAGYVLTSNTLRPLPKSVVKLMKQGWDPLTTKEDILRFQGSLNWLSKYMPPVIHIKHAISRHLTDNDNIEEKTYIQNHSGICFHAIVYKQTKVGGPLRVLTICRKDRWELPYLTKTGNEPVNHGDLETLLIQHLSNTYGLSTKSFVPGGSTYHLPPMQCVDRIWSKLKNTYQKRI